MNFYYLLYCITLVSIVVVYSKMFSNLRKQNTYLKKKLTDLALKTGNNDYVMYNISDNDKDKMINLKRSGNKIQAIKILKENYRMSLVEAKDYIDLL